MSALNEALLSAQRQALAAMQRAYLAGAMDVDEVGENLDSIDLLDVLQRRALLNAWAIWEMPDPAPLGAYSTGYQGDSEQYQRAVARILMLEERLP